MGNRFLNFINSLNVSKYVFLGGLAILIAFICLVIFMLIKIQLWLSEKKNGYLLLPVISVLCACILVAVYTTGICVDDLVVIGYCVSIVSSITSIIISLMILINK